MPRPKSSYDLPPINTSSGKSASGMPPIPPINTSSPKSRNTSPKSRNTSPKSRNTSPKSRNTSPKSRNTSPKSRNTSPKSRNTSPKSRNTSPKTTPERSIEKTDTNNTKNTRLTKKERLKKNINKIPLELISHISSYVPNISYKHVGKKTETQEYKDKYYRFNLIPPYAINLALKLSDILGYDTPHVNTKLIYDKIANTLYRWYVYADQDWDKFIKDYPKEGECVNILYIDKKEEILKEYPNKCYHIFTEKHEWTQAIAFASLGDRTARYIDKSILNDIEEIMVNEPLYIHDKRLDKKGGQRNTRKNRGV